MSDYIGPLAGAAFLFVITGGLVLLAQGISYLFRRAGVKKARDPDTPPEELLTLAEQYPEVLQNPAHPLLLLEDPERWLAIKTRAEEAAVQRRQEAREFYKILARTLVFPALMVLIVFLVWLFRRC